MYWPNSAWRSLRVCARLELKLQSTNTTGQRTVSLKLYRSRTSQDGHWTIVLHGSVRVFRHHRRSVRTSCCVWMAGTSNAPMPTGAGIRGRGAWQAGLSGAICPFGSDRIQHTDVRSAAVDMIVGDCRDGLNATIKDPVTHAVWPWSGHIESTSSGSRTAEFTFIESRQSRVPIDGT